ncbi:hypothetical protein ES702_07781 [subsurface metagenome]
MSNIVTKWKVNRWLSELFVFKLYHFVGAILVSSVAYHAAYSMGAIQEIPWYTLAKDALLAGAAAWLSIVLIVRVNRGLRLDRELRSHPLEWSKGSTAAFTLFVLISFSLGAPLLRYLGSPTALINLTILVVVLIATTSAFSIYLWAYWNASQLEKKRSIAALKAEHHFWSILFSCGVIWIGVFIGGVILSGMLTDLQKTLRDIPETLFYRVILYQGMVVFYAFGGTVAWILRSLHRRLEQISRAMDLLPPKNH